MTFEAMANTIRSRFKTLVGDVEKIPVHYDNEQKDKPENKLWARLNILPGQSIQVEIGKSERFRTPGVMIVQLFLPIGKGMRDLHKMADKIKTAFRAVTVTGVVFRTPSEENVGRTGSWWQMNVSIPFYADDTT